MLLFSNYHESPFQGLEGMCSELQLTTLTSTFPFQDGSIDLNWHARPSVVSSHTFSPQVSLSSICEQKEHLQPQVLCPSTILPTLLGYFYSKLLKKFQGVLNFVDFVCFQLQFICNFTKCKPLPCCGVTFKVHLYISDNFLCSLTLNLEI